jgi:hypothetical protein
MYTTQAPKHNVPASAELENRTIATLPQAEETAKAVSTNTYKLPSAFITLSHHLSSLLYRLLTRTTATPVSILDKTIGRFVS